MMEGSGVLALLAYRQSSVVDGMTQDLAGKNFAVFVAVASGMTHEVVKQVLGCVLLAELVMYVLVGVVNSGNGAGGYLTDTVRT